MDDAVAAPGARRMAPLTLATLPDLPEACRRCLVWELDDAAREQAERGGDPAFEKEAWLSSVQLAWGAAGRVAYVGEEPAGYVAAAPPVYAPRAAMLPSAPVSPDAVLLLVGHVAAGRRGAGVARMLVQGVAKDLTQRGVRAVEAFALATGAARGCPAGERAGPEGTPHGLAGGPRCLLPQALYEAVGFTVVREHHVVPRLRLELRSALAWREDVEAALEQLLESVALASRA